MSRCLHKILDCIVLAMVSFRLTTQSPSSMRRLPTDGSSPQTKLTKPPSKRQFPQAAVLVTQQPGSVPNFA